MRWVGFRETMRPRRWSYIGGGLYRWADLQGSGPPQGGAHDVEDAAPRRAEELLAQFPRRDGATLTGLLIEEQVREVLDERREIGRLVPGEPAAGADVVDLREADGVGVVAGDDDGPARAE